MLVPHENLHLEVKDTDLIATLNWLEIIYEIHENEVESVKECITSFNKDWRSPNAQALLSEFEDNTFFFREPRQDLQAKTTPKRDLLKSFVLKNSSPHSKELANKLKRLSESSPGVFDPITAYGFLRGRIFNIDAHTREIFPYFEELKGRDDASFLSSLEISLQQTHHITNNFCPNLTKRNELFEEIEKDMQAIYDSEIGHDKLISHSLKELGDEPCPSKVFEETKSLLEIQKTIMTHSPLIFLVLYDYLEGDGYTETDPLVDLIEKSSKPRAALGMKKHYEINKSEKHNEVSGNIIKKLSPLEELDIDVAAALFVQLESCILQLNKKIYEGVKNA